MGKTFHHGGRIGDLIFALWTMKNLGGGELYISDYHKSNWDLDVARKLDGLLCYQSYIHNVRYVPYKNLPIVSHDLQKAEKDFNPEKFPNWAPENGWPGNANILRRYAVHFGLDEEYCMWDAMGRPAWMDGPKGWAWDVVVHCPIRRSIRPYDEWEAIIAGLRDKGLQVTVPGIEPLQQTEIPFSQFTAHVNCSQVFLGTVSSGNALAEAFGKPRLVEQAPDCFNVSPTKCINGMPVERVIEEVLKYVRAPSY